MIMQKIGDNYLYGRNGECSTIVQNGEIEGNPFHLTLKEIVRNRYAKFEFELEYNTNGGYKRIIHKENINCDKALETIANHCRKFKAWLKEILK